ncbi:glycerate kinase [Idiomarina xiamenensis]|uniref:Glycerate kinase n=1 Tax=Idiomarina xiamenensis 10-D-4 TaxID=740709 RepID=K2KPV7_9GAMM|nr:glycerate kinase [Idiomarina xiamenensis]EKE84504.1 glycerate kinase [Idiomarina xiamenensis 10-D-4]
MALTVLIAPDSFKESLSALAVCEAISAGIQRADPDVTCLSLPLADGGEGTVDALLAAHADSAQRYQSWVQGPISNNDDDVNSVCASWGAFSSTDNGVVDTAVIETAAASGLALVAAQQRDALAASSYGTGQLLREALKLPQLKHIVLGLGGSASSDGGAGLLQALGAVLYDDDEQPLEQGIGGGALARCARIDWQGIYDDPISSRIFSVDVELLCDVSNPLLGEQGSVAVFAPQKGANSQQQAQLEAALTRYNQALVQACGRDVCDIPGAGAAGGIAAALLALCQAHISGGIDRVLAQLNFDRLLQQADLVITGEGRIDSQSLQGKVPIGVAQRAQQAGKPVIALVGAYQGELSAFYEQGISAVFSVVDGPAELSQALRSGAVNVSRCAENLMRSLRLALPH